MASVVEPYNDYRIAVPVPTLDKFRLRFRIQTIYKQFFNKNCVQNHTSHEFKACQAILILLGGLHAINSVLDTNHNVTRT
jgi:hypothetical protein